MTDHGDTVLREALALPADERAQVAADLLASLDEEREGTEEVTPSWAAEIERRARQALDGQSSGEDWDTARDRIAGQLRSR
jgi:putative addiction module component (TIGR02574 family)